MLSIDSLSRECFRSFAVLPGAQLISNGEVFGVMTGLPRTFFNGIATTNFDGAGVDAAIERTIEPFRANDCAFRWWVTPGTRPAELGPMLAAHGLRHVYDSAAMTADLTRPAANVAVEGDLDIRRVAGIEEMQEWSNVLLRVFGASAFETDAWLTAFSQIGLHEDSSWAHFVAFAGGSAVATTSLMLAGELAGVYHVATLPEARGRGIGAAVNAAALQYARERGAREAVLQSSEMAVGVYRRIGFVQTSTVGMYEWRPGDGPHMTP